MTKKYEKEVKKYFADKAEGYDDVEFQKYWVLSDKLLWFLLKEKLDTLQEDFYFLDAGGGTGRWSKKILENYPKSKGVLLDMSPEMLSVAKTKNEFGKRWELLEGDIQKMAFKENTFNLVINTHNVLGFVEKKDKAISEMVRVLKKGGLLISVIPNLYHAVFFNISQGNLPGAKHIIKNERGKFVSNMPEMDMFTQDSIKILYENNSVGKFSCNGFPISIYPGYKETQLHGETNELKDILEEKMEEVYKIESKIIKDSSAWARGNNLFVSGEKL